MNESSVEFKKTDGNPIRFNFQLPNGLPVKTILTPPFDFVHSSKTNEYGIYITFSQLELKDINQIDIIEFKIYNNDIWIILKNHYIVLYNLNDKIIQELKNKNLGFCFFNLNKEFIKGFKFD